MDQDSQKPSTPHKKSQPRERGTARHPSAMLADKDFSSKWIVKTPAEVIRASFLSTNAKVILLVISSYADKNGIAYPKIETICKDSNLNKKTVQRYTKELLAFNLLEKLKVPKRKSGEATTYRVKIPQKHSGQKRSSNSYHSEEVSYSTDRTGKWLEKRTRNKIVITPVFGEHPAGNATDNERHPDSCDCFFCQRDIPAPKGYSPPASRCFCNQCIAER